jgi:hypothetical protein
VGSGTALDAIMAKNRNPVLLFKAPNLGYEHAEWITHHSRSKNQTNLILEGGVE